MLKKIVLNASVICLLIAIAILFIKLQLHEFLNPNRNPTTIKGDAICEQESILKKIIPHARFMCVILGIFFLLSMIKFQTREEIVEKKNTLSIEVLQGAENVLATDLTELVFLEKKSTYGKSVPLPLLFKDVPVEVGYFMYSIQHDTAQYKIDWRKEYQQDVTILRIGIYVGNKFTVLYENNEYEYHNRRFVKKKT